MRRSLPASIENKIKSYTNPVRQLSTVSNYVHIIGAADEPLGRIAHDGAIILPMNRGACQYRTGIPGSLHRARAIALRTNVSRLITPDQDFPAFIKAGEEYAHEPPLNARISCQNWRCGRGRQP